MRKGKRTMRWRAYQAALRLVPGGFGQPGQRRVMLDYCTIAFARGFAAGKREAKQQYSQVHGSE